MIDSPTTAKLIAQPDPVAALWASIFQSIAGIQKVADEYARVAAENERLIAALSRPDVPTRYEARIQP